MIDRPKHTGRALRIALVNLRSNSNDWHHLMMVPLGLMYVSAALKRAFGDEVEVRQFDMMTLPYHTEGYDKVRAFLAEANPDVVGIRGFTTQAAEYPLVAAMAKEVNPACISIAGGPHASTRSKTLFESEAIDYVCVEEGEETVVEFVGNLLAGRPQEGTLGLGWLDGGQIHFNPPRPLIQDLDALPFPDYSIIDLDAYQGQLAMTDFLTKGRFSSLFTSRGCPYRCVYCHDNFGKRVRYRSVESVIAEIDYLMSEHGVTDFQIVDDIFNANKKRAIAIFNEVVRRGWKIWFAFPNGLRGDLFDDEFVAAAKEAGAYHWGIAVETATPRLQKLIKKNNKLDRVFEAIELSDKHGVFTATFNMLGFPTETEDEMMETVNFSLRSKAHITHLFVATPFEGTEFFEMMVAAGYQLDTGRIGQGVTNFAADNTEQDYALVPRPRIEAIMVDAIGRFHFDARRMQRMIALTDFGHNHAHLAMHLERRRWTAGLDYAIIAQRDPAAARQLAWLNSTAKAQEPELCKYLPDPPAELLAVAAGPPAA
ncbi:MAG: radical SAM protein [Planctomycetota bacterium]